ncbi:MAG: hypothetical protein WAT70_04765 [Rhizobiaceae bacterium]
MFWVITTIAYALAAGLAFGGMAATLIREFGGGEPRFRPPFADPAHVLRSLGITLAAGPYMLANEAIAARREGAISGLSFATALLLCAAWALAAGVVLVFLAETLTGQTA